MSIEINSKIDIMCISSIDANISIYCQSITYENITSCFINELSKQINNGFVPNKWYVASGVIFHPGVFLENLHIF